MPKLIRKIDAGTQLSTTDLSIVAEKYIACGRFSNVYISQYNGRKVAVKLYKQGSRNNDYFRNEYRLYKTIEQHRADLTGSDYVINMLDVFCYMREDSLLNTINIHPCFVFPLLGESLMRMLRQLDGNLEIKTVKNMSKQVLSGIAFLHSLKIIHADIKAENILLKKPLADYNNESELEICIVDFGSSTFADKIFTQTVGTLECASPELIIRSGYSFPTDIWSFGCLVFELLTDSPIFTTKDDSESHEGGAEDDKDSEGGASSSGSEDENVLDSDESDYEQEIEGGAGDKPDDASDKMGRSSIDSDLEWQEERLMLISFQNLLGSMPISMAKQNRDFFNTQGRVKAYANTEKKDLGKILIEQHEFTKKEAKEISGFLLSLFKYLPDERPTADVLLNSAFFKV